MEPSFWRERWSQGQIGFHEGAPNRFLLRYLDRLGPPGNVFVPLCGKTYDLDALAQHGHDVTGCELVTQAVEDYFRERNLSATQRPQDSATVYEHGSLRVHCGDVFAFASDKAPFDSVFDRAALVALPDEMRERYAAKITSLLRPNATMLLVTMEHDLGAGPPHSVTEEMVRALYSNAFDIEPLANEDVTADNPRFTERGATYVRERAYQLTKR